MLTVTFISHFALTIPVMPVRLTMIVMVMMYAKKDAAWSVFQVILVRLRNPYAAITFASVSPTVIALHHLLTVMKKLAENVFPTEIVRPQSLFVIAPNAEDVVKILNARATLAIQQLATAISIMIIHTAPKVALNWCLHWRQLLTDATWIPVAVAFITMMVMVITICIKELKLVVLIPGMKLGLRPNRSPTDDEQTIGRQKN